MINIVFASDKNKKEQICENYISISGSTNINEFVLQNKELELNHIKILPFIEGENISTDTSSIAIPVNEFYCKNRLMQRDFQKLLKSSEYPNISVTLTKNATPLSDPQSSTNFTIIISLAGVTQKYDVLCDVSSCGDSEFQLKGEKQINLSDFNITPPEKVFGTIKVKDEVFINFAFKFILEEV